MAGTGTSIWVSGTAVKLSGEVAPHVGWMASAGGRAAEGDYRGAAIESANGASRTAAVGYLGTAVGTSVGIWASGEAGALLGAPAGPWGIAAGFIAGCGAAWLGGMVWDETVGAGADHLDQWSADRQAQNQYGGQRRNQRQNVRQIRRNGPPPARSGVRKRCDGRGSCGRK